MFSVRKHVTACRVWTCTLCTMARIAEWKLHNATFFCCSRLYHVPCLMPCHHLQACSRGRCSCTRSRGISSACPPPPPPPPPMKLCMEAACNPASLWSSPASKVLSALKLEQCLQALRLSPVQQGQILMWRQEHLHQMRELYEERQKLNMEVSHFSEHALCQCAQAAGAVRGPAGPQRQYELLLSQCTWRNMTSKHAVGLCRPSTL